METSLIKKGRTTLQVHPDLEALSHHAASFFVTFSRNAVAKRSRFAVALSGGSTPERFYTLLSMPPYCDEVEWKSVHVFWADERCVSRDHEQSNYKMAFHALLSKVPIPEGNIHPLGGEGDPITGARQYEEIIRKFFGESALPRFDLIILGAGEDGHTASLFPGSNALDERVSLAVAVYLPSPRHNRITLTLPILNHAAHILVLVSGYSKAEMIARIFRDVDNKAPFPVALVRPSNGRVTWLIDEGAAMSLKRNQLTNA